jgi:uncharacterized protein YfeS
MEEERMKNKEKFELFTEEERIEPVDSTTIKTAFSVFARKEFDCLIMETKELIHNSRFIQVAHDNGGYILEIQFVINSRLQQYQKETSDVQICRAAFLNYLEGLIPDLTDWREITEELYYYDDETDGVSPTTSHPSFVKYFSDESYYKIAEETSPFGNDTGNDILSMLEQYIEETEDLVAMETLPLFFANEWKVPFFDPLKTYQDLEHIEQNQMDIILSCQITVAVGLGMIKITGKINSLLKKQTICALKQLQILLPAEKLIYQKQIDDLQKYFEEVI